MPRLPKCGRRSATSRRRRRSAASGFHSALTITPQASADLITARVKAAFGRLKDFTPYKVQTPVTVDISFKHYMPAEVLAYLPMFERTGSHSIRYRARDMVEADAIREFVREYRPDLTPSLRFPQWGRVCFQKLRHLR